MNRRLWKEIAAARWAFWLTVVLQVVATACMVIQAWAFSQIVNRTFLLHTSLDELHDWFLLAIFGVVGRALAGWLGTIVAAHLATAVKAGMRRRTMAYLLALGPAFMKSERSGEIVTTLAEGVERLDHYFREYLSAIVSAVLIPLCIILLVLPLDFMTFLVLLLTAPLVPLFMALIGMAAGRLARQQHARMSLLGAHFLDVLQGLTTLRLLNRGKVQVQSIRRITDDFRGATMQVLRVAFLSALTLEMLATLSVAIIAVEIGVRLLHGGIRFEHALFLLVIAPEYYLPLRTLGARFHSGTEGAAVADRLYALLDTLPQGKTDGRCDVPAWKTLRIQDVHFAYTPERPALNGVSLSVERGQRVALIGESGSGKTTLSSLLLRFLSPQQGDVYLDDVPLSAVDVSAWRAQIAWVSQKPYLFNETVEDNIRVGRQDATYDEVIAAAKAANAHDFIMKLPQGYATPCGERGLQLSGGQAQRIAIARAFLKDAPFILLDEPTANLDAESEAQVMGALRRLSENRTVLSIAHRLDTVIDADAIYVMHDGCIVEQGSHRALSQRNGLYTQMRQDYGQDVFANSEMDVAIR